MHQPDSSSEPPLRASSPLAAVAAGAVGALSLGASEAAIVYVNFGDAVIADVAVNDGAARLFPLDFDGNGMSDLRLLVQADATQGNAAAVAAPSGGVVDVVGAASGAFLYPDRLAPNKGVGSSAAFIPLAGNAIGTMAFRSGYPNSNWATAAGNSGYLGLRFKISGNSHYGWLRLTVALNSAPQPRAITVHEWGYETTPNTMILTGAVPEPGGLGLLALGGVGVALHRRRRLAAAPDTAPAEGPS